MTLSLLIQELTCPVGWDQTSVGPELGRWLDFLWFAECHQHQVSGEVSALFTTDDWRPAEDHLLLVDNEASVLRNVRTWVGKARTSYKSFARRFTALVVADRRVYPKHYSPNTNSLSDVCDLSLRQGESVLLPIATPSLQESLVWAALDDLAFKQMTGLDDHFRLHAMPEPGSHRLKELLGLDSVVVAVNLSRTIGATRGLPTSHAMMDFDFSTPQIHMYPISEEEYKAATYQAYVQGWNFGLPRESDA